MIAKDFIQQLSQQLSTAMPEFARQAQGELQQNLHVLIKQAFTKLDLVTREEYEETRVVLENTRLKLEQLEAKLRELESNKAP